jgi:hypothetical protein
MNNIEQTIGTEFEQIGFYIDTKWKKYCTNLAKTLVGFCARTKIWLE